MTRETHYADLVRRVRTGDLEAFAFLVRLFQDMAFGYAISLTGNFHVAEDAVQEAFVDVFSRIHELRVPEAFPGWFRRVVFKHCDRLTRQKPLRCVPLESAASIPSSEPDPEHATRCGELARRVMEEIAGLPAHERSAAALYLVDGYSQKEIADFLEVPVTTVKKRLHDARTRLRPRMMAMLSETLKEKSRRERLPRRIIEALLSRPRPLEIDGHPVRTLWYAIRRALPDYEVVEGEEIAKSAVMAAVESDKRNLYRVDGERVLRGQMTATTLVAVRGRRPPLKVLAAGRVFRPVRESAVRLQVFHQADGMCIAPGATVELLQATVAGLLTTVLSAAEVRWRKARFRGFKHGLEVDARLGTSWRDVGGCGLMTADLLRSAGFDPAETAGMAFGIGLDRLAACKLGIRDLRVLWRPPYVSGA